MNLLEEVLDATLEADGTLRLSQVPQVLPGPVRVTIRTTHTASHRGLSDVLRDIVAEQKSRGFMGRSAADIQSQLQDGSDDRDSEQDAARSSAGGGV